MAADLHNWRTGSSDRVFDGLDWQRNDRVGRVLLELSLLSLWLSSQHGKPIRSGKRLVGSHSVLGTRNRSTFSSIRAYRGLDRFVHADLGRDAGTLYSNQHRGSLLAGLSAAGGRRKSPLPGRVFGSWRDDDTPRWVRLKRPQFRSGAQQRYQRLPLAPRWNRDPGEWGQGI